MQCGDYFVDHEAKILESNRRFFHEDGASRHLLRNQRFNVKIEEILDNSQQQGKAGRRRFMF